MSARITAKVRLQARQEFQDDQQMLTFAPDYSDGRNQEWAKYTPALNLTMTVKAEVGNKLNVGDNFTLVFEPEED
jgi:hypothetical protein